jgi:hypothetical protein
MPHCAQERFDTVSAQWRVVTDQLRARYPKLAELVDTAEADVLAFMTFPKLHRTQIHSTHPLERLNAEIKRRTDVVGIFPNAAAITRWRARCCSSRTTSGNCGEGTWPSSGCELWPTTNPLGCPPWSAEHESNPTRTHDSYTAPRDTIRAPSAERRR